MNATTSARSAVLNIGERVEQQVRLHPDAIAVIAEQETVTYAQLWSRVEAISCLLRAAEVEREENVGVLLGRRVDLVAAVIAVWHAGGTLVPVDPDDPVLRNGHILRLAQCRLIVSNADALRRQPGLLAKQRAFQVIDVAGAVGGSDPVDAAYLPGTGLAYILFTSGSTGLPKGVEIEHRSVSHFLDCVHALFGTGADDRYLATATIGFDVSFAEIFMPLTSGASMVLRHRELWLQPKELAREVVCQGVTVCSTGPSVWALALSEVPEFPRIRIALSSGEAMLPWVAARLPHIADAAWNVYGPTETTIWCSGRQMPAASEAEVVTFFNNIGPPFATAQVRVVRPDGTQCAANEQGEFWFSGIALARGYHRRPDLTHASFVEVDGERFYKSGDVGSIDERGELFFLGRNDDQMKVHGVRIEPGEIESVLLGHPDIQTAAVTWVEIEPGNRIVAAAWVPVEGATLVRADLVGWVADRLPAAMMPGRWIRLDALPQTPSNKVDRGAIRALIGKAQAECLVEEDVALTPTETRIANIWKRTLHVRQIARNDQFLELGGDSIAMVRMLAGVQQEFGASVSIQDAFDRPTLESFAALVEQVGRDKAAVAANDWVQPLVRVSNAPSIFFCGTDLKVAMSRQWALPVSLFGVFNWAPGKGFLEVKDLESLARRQIGNMRKYQSVGPYWLGGFSFGGLLALEMARQLERAGEEVAMVFLLDPMPPPASGLISRIRFTRLGRWLGYQLMQRHFRAGSWLPSTMLPKLRQAADWRYSLKTAKVYQAQPFGGPSVLLVADEAVNRSYWDSVLTNQVAYREFATTHHELQRAPWLGQWMEVLGAVIDRMPERTVNGT